MKPFTISRRGRSMSALHKTSEPAQFWTEVPCVTSQQAFTAPASAAHAPTACRFPLPPTALTVLNCNRNSLHGNFSASWGGPCIRTSPFASIYTLHCRGMCTSPPFTVTDALCTVWLLEAATGDTGTPCYLSSQDVTVFMVNSS